MLANSVCYHFTNLSEIENDRDVFVSIALCECRALPPFSRIRIKYVTNVVSFSGIGTPSVAHSASSRFWWFAKGLGFFFATSGISEYLGFRCNVERRWKQSTVFQALAGTELISLTWEKKNINSASVNLLYMTWTLSIIIPKSTHNL